MHSSNTHLLGIQLQSWIPNLAITLLMSIKEVLLANILKVRKHQVKFCTSQYKKDSNKDICFFSNWGLMMNVIFVLLSKKAFPTFLRVRQKVSRSLSLVFDTFLLFHWYP